MCVCEVLHKSTSVRYSNRYFLVRLFIKTTRERLWHLLNTYVRWFDMEGIRHNRYFMMEIQLLEAVCPKKGPLMQIFEVVFAVSSKNCWTNNRASIDLRPRTWHSCNDLMLRIISVLLQCVILRCNSRDPPTTKKGGYCHTFNEPILQVNLSHRSLDKTGLH